MAQRIKHLPAMQETWIWCLDWEDPLEKEMAIHSSILAWRNLWTNEHVRLQSTGLQRVRQDWVTSLFLLRLLPKAQFSSIQFSCSVVSDSLRPHGLQHARPPCPSPTPELTQTHVHWVGDAIHPAHPLSVPSHPAFNLSQHQGLFQWVNSLVLSFLYSPTLTVIHDYWKKHRFD